MSYEKYGYNTNHPFAKPLYGKKKSQKFSVVFDDDMQNLFADDGKHPLFKVDSGLPKSLGDALGDLDPDFASSAILSFIYGLRTLKVVKGKAKKLFGTFKEKAKAYNGKFTKGYDEVLATGGEFDAETSLEESIQKSGFVPEITSETLKELSKWGEGAQLKSIKNENEKLKKEFRPLRLVLNELTRFYLSTVEGEVELEKVTLRAEQAGFLNRLSNLGLDAELIKGVKCLLPEDFKKFRNLVDFRFDEFKVWDSASRGYIMVKKAVLCSEPKNVVEKPWQPSKDWPQKALVEECLKGYTPLSDIYNDQKLGSFEAEPGLDSSEPETSKD